MREVREGDDSIHGELAQNEIRVCEKSTNLGLSVAVKAEKLPKSLSSPFARRVTKNDKIPKFNLKNEDFMTIYPF